MGLLPSSFWEAMDSFTEWADSLGLIGLALLTFTEAIFQPIPPETLILPMLVSADGAIGMIVAIWLVATLSSVGGAVVAHWLGRNLGLNVAERFIAPLHVKRLQNLTRRYGDFGIFIAALSPIPYKVLAWVAGMGEMDQRRFIQAGLLGRGLRFGIEAVAIGIWGAELLETLANPWAWAFVSIIGIALLIPAKRWWDGLLDEEE